MNLILHTVKQEKQRIEYMLGKYQEELSDLPKGTISEKAVGEKTYYYLKYHAQSGCGIRKHIDRPISPILINTQIFEK